MTDALVSHLGDEAGEHRSMLEVLDEDRPAVSGPAGWSTLHLPAGVTLAFDHLDPARLLRVSVDPLQLDDEQQADKRRGILEAVLGVEPTAALLERSSAPATVQLLPSANTHSAGRLAGLLASLTSTWRHLDSLWASEAASLARQVHSSLVPWAEAMEGQALPSLALLPVDQIQELFTPAASALESLAFAGTLGQDPRLRALHDAIRQVIPSSTPTIEHALSEPAMLRSAMHHQAGRTRSGVPVLHGTLGGELIEGSPLVDPAVERPGLFRSPPAYFVDDVAARVELELSELAGKLPARFLSTVRAVIRNTEGMVLDRSGFEIEGGTATANFLGVDQLGTELWFDVTAASRGLRVTPDERDVDRAAAAGRRAAGLERLAAATFGPHREHLRDAAVDAWYECASRWRAAQRSSQEALAVRRAKAIDGSIEAAEPFAVEQLTPALTYWLDGLDPEELDDSELLESERMAEAVGAAKARVRLGLNAVSREALVHEIDLDEVVWSALGANDADLFEQALSAWHRLESRLDDDF